MDKTEETSVGGAEQDRGSMKEAQTGDSLTPRSPRVALERWIRSLPQVIALNWQFCAIVAGSALLKLSSALHYGFPPGAGGLYTLASELIADNGFVPPARIPWYTASGIPFAYPPLMFYVMASVRATLGVSFIDFERFAPVLFSTLYLVPGYLLARELLHSKRAALVATLILSISPSVFFWHLDAGGFVRAPGYLFFVAGFYSYVKAIRTRRLLFVVLSAMFLGLVLLTHPGYSLLLVGSIVLFGLAEGRSWFGVRVTLGVLVCGSLVASIWWGPVLARHGIETQLSPFGARNAGLGSIFSLLTLSFHNEPYVPIWNVLAVVGVAGQVAKRKFLLAAWLLLIIVIYPRSTEGAYLAISLLAGSAIGDIIVPHIREIGDSAWGDLAATAFVALLVVYGVGSFVTVTRHVLGPSSFSPYVSGSDLEAMQWISRVTPPDSQFVVLGSQAEWFPAIAHRTSLVGTWGTEWVPGQWDRQQHIQKDLASCSTNGGEVCLNKVIKDNSLPADAYLYVPKDPGSALLLADLMASRDRVVFENRGVALFRRSGEPVS